VKKLGCSSIGRLLGQYVDGELPGSERLRVSRHLGVCEACAREVDAMGGLGDLLRRAAADDEAPAGIEGLASSVVTRVRAESAVSWAARFERAVGDSRLLWVGTGSVLGAMATMLVVAFAVFFGQARAMAGDLDTFGRAGTLFAVARAEDGRNDSMLVHYDQAEGSRLITEEMLSGPTERQVVAALADLMTRHGRVVGLEQMTPADRARTLELLDEYIRRQSKELVRVEVQQVRLIATAEVTAKGL